MRVSARRDPVTLKVYKCFSFIACNTLKQGVLHASTNSHGEDLGGPVVPVILATMPLSSNRAKSKKPLTRDVATDLHYSHFIARVVGFSLTDAETRAAEV